jgi:hypothetical protein
MRPYLLYAASLAAAIVAGDFCVAQAHADHHRARVVVEHPCLRGDFAHTDDDAQRLITLGAPEVVVCGNLKFDRSPSAQDFELGERLRSWFGARPVFLAASTREGEEEKVLAAVELAAQAQLLTVIVPRHPQRFNAVAKLLAEGGLPDEVRAAAVVSVPFDLGLCCRAIDSPGFFPLLYRRRFLRQLRRKALEKARRFPLEINVPAVKAARMLREFDDAVTAPLHGFADAMDYYTRCSSGPLLGRVDRPLHILHAEDDPMIPVEAIPVDRSNRNLTWEIHAAGGHVGFVTGPRFSPRRYAESRVAEVLAARLRSL